MQAKFRFCVCTYRAVTFFWENIFSIGFFLCLKHALGFKTHVVRASNSSWARRYRRWKMTEFPKNPENPRSFVLVLLGRLDFLVSSEKKNSAFFLSSVGRRYGYYIGLVHAYTKTMLHKILENTKFWWFLDFWLHFWGADPWKHAKIGNCISFQTQSWIEIGSENHENSKLWNFEYFLPHSFSIRMY